MASKTQGGRLYAIDPANDAVVPITRLTNFQSGDQAASEIDDTDFDDEIYFSKLRGLSEPGAATFDLNVTPSDASHALLYSLRVSTSQVPGKFVFGWSDGTSAPTVDSNGNFNLPTDRTWYEFGGFVSNFPFSHEVNSIVKTAVSIVKEGGGVWTPKTA